MKKLIFSVMALAAIATANAEELNVNNVVNNESAAAVVAPAETAAPETETVEKNNWGLILVKDALVEQKTKDLTNPKGKSCSGKKLNRSGDLGLYTKGYQDGKNLGTDQKAITA